MNRERYLELLKKSLMGALHPEPEPVPDEGDLARCRARLEEGRRRFPDARGSAAQMLHSSPEALFTFLNDMSARQHKHTMTVESGVDNVRACVEQVLRDGIAGDLLEAGVWKGGLPLYMRGILAAHGDTTRTVWLADSFAGLPQPDFATAPEDAVAISSATASATSP